MRRLVLLLCLALFAKASFAQTIQLTNGGSTTVTGATSAVPISTFFEYMRFQVVYTAAELNAAGITGSKTVTQLGWYVSTAPGGALPGYKIRMANTTATNSAAHNAAALTEVYSVASYTPVAGGFDMLNLNGSFIWNGTDNLLVDVCFGAAPYLSPYGALRTYAATTTSGSRYVRCDGCGSQCAATTNTANTFKPQVSLTFAAPPSCLAPGSLSVTPGVTSAALSWAAVGGATGYEWAVTTSATPPASGTATALTTANAGSLTAITPYYAHVRAVCGGPTSTWITTPFSTLCATGTIPYSENFDAAGTPPPCFAFQDLNGNTTWSIFTGGGNGAASAPNSIRYNWNTPVGGDDWFFLQGLSFTSGTTYRLKFKYKASNGPTFIEKLEVKYGSSPNAASMTTGTLFTNTNINNAVADPFIQASVDFTPASSGDFYIGFHCFSDADQAFLYIDDIEVILAPSCSDPSGIVIVPTNNSATINWNPVTGATGYEWAYSTINTPPGSGTATALTTANPTGLAALTKYYVFIRTVCAGPVFSSWAIDSFTTSIDCSAATLISGCGVSQTATIAAGTGVYSNNACGFSTPGIEQLYTFTPAVTGNYTLNITAATGGYIDYMFKAAAGGCGPTGWTCIDDNNAAGTDVFGPLTAGTTYFLLLDPENTTGVTHTFQLDCPVATPVNDTVCGAIALTLGGAQDCKNTTGATSVSDPVLPGSCSTPNNTLWYSYTPATTGPVVIRTEIPGATTNGLIGWAAWYTATGTCPSPPGLTLTALSGSVCQAFGQTGAGDVDSLLSPVLTAGTTYYIMIDGNSGDVGEFCINLIAPPAPPACTTNLTPANAATGVTSVPAGVVLTWNAAPGATSYDVFFGTTNPPTANIGNTTGTTATITGTAYNTTYYWYVVPKNTGGAATGCQTSTTSFTTENPTNCLPLYTTGCSANDTLGYFSLKGALGTVIYNNYTPRCNNTPNSYNDYTGLFPAVTLVRGESFSGFMQAGDPNDWVTMWIDGNDNGFFEDNERIMNNLSVGTSLKLYSLYIPASIPTGTHRLRVRLIYSVGRPAAPTHPCNAYQYGTTEDYTVTVSSTGSTHLVASGTANTCVNAGEIVIDAASNNNVNAPVYVVDSSNNYVCAVYPDGNSLGTVRTTAYVNSGPVRQDVTGRYYLDRNISVAVDTQPATPYRFRYFYLNSELNALIAQPGSGVTSQFDLNMTKTTGTDCVPAYVQQTPTFQSPVGFGSLGSDRFVDFTGFTSFSRFFLHGGASVLLPVRLTNFRGEVTGASNTVYWTTEQEQNNRKFIVERSADGVRFEAIGEVNTQAPNGNSTSRLNYSFADNAPISGRSYYRLNMVDLNDRQTASPIVTLQRGGGKFEIVDVRPNPTTGLVYFNLLGSNTGATVVVRSMNGTEVMRKQFTQPANFSLDISGLANGLYMLEATDRNGEKAIFKVAKQ